MKKKVLVVAMSTMFLLGALSGCGSTSDSSESGSSSASSVSSSAEASSSASSSAASSEAEDENADSEEASNLAIGETGTLDNWSVTVTNFEFLDSVQNTFGEFTPEAGNKFGLVSLSITNNGKESSTFLPSFGLNNDVQAIIVYGDGYEYSLTNLIGYENSIIDSTVNPLTSKEGAVAFELPQAVVDGTEPLILKITKGSNELNISLR